MKKKLTALLLLITLLFAGCAGAVEEITSSDESSLPTDVESLAEWEARVKQLNALYGEEATRLNLDRILLSKGGTVTPSREATGKIALLTDGKELKNGTSDGTVKFAGNSKTYPLTATQPGIYTGSIPTVKAGVYKLMVTQNDLSGGAMDYLALPLAVTYCQEYNVFDPQGEELLRSCCNHTGGQLYTDMQALANLPVGSVRSYFNPLFLFALISAVLMIADISIRKLRWKDVQDFFSRKKV